jgi:hypothetical protein
MGVACRQCGAAIHGARCATCGAPSKPELSGAESAARIAMTDESVLALLRSHFARAESTYLCPTIPPKKEKTARLVHSAHLSLRELVLALYDDTVFGSASDGFVITSRRLCWKNAADRPRAVEWRDLDPESMWNDRRKLVLGPGMELSGDESVIDACEEVFYVLAVSARASAGRRSVPPSASGFAPPMPRSGPALATPPPPHAISYAAYAVHAASQRPPAFACWQCNTPLYWNTPQCARCGAWPTPRGWLRTA